MRDVLDKALFKEKIEELVRFYPTWRMQTDEPYTMRLWYGKFSFMDDYNFKKMVNDYVRKEVRNPTIAGLLKHTDEDEIRGKSVDISMDDMIDFPIFSDTERKK